MVTRSRLLKTAGPREQETPTLESKGVSLSCGRKRRIHMLIDELELTLDGQAVVGSPSQRTRSIRAPQIPELGRGEPTAMVIETIEATDDALTANVNVLSRVHGLAMDLSAGSPNFVAIPPGVTKRFLALRYVPMGGAATVTVRLTSESLFAGLDRQYPANSVA